MHIADIINSALEKVDMDMFTGPESDSDDQPTSIDCVVGDENESEAILIMRDSQEIHCFFLCETCSVSVFHNIQAVIQQLGFGEMIQVGIVRKGNPKFDVMLNDALNS